jgi:tetratricopeptide (TPR) repeat protein
MGRRRTFEAFDGRCLEAARAMGDEEWAARLRSEIGYARLEEGDWAAAEDLFRQAQAYYDASPILSLDQARLRRYRAQAALAMGDADGALTLLAGAEQILDTAPFVEDMPLARMLLHSARMTVYHQRGDLDAAEAAGRETERWFARLEPAKAGQDYGEFRVELGDILFRLGRSKESEGQWQTFLSSREGLPHLYDHNDHAEAQLRLAWLYAGRGERDAAARLAQAARQTCDRRGRLARGRQIDELLDAIESRDELPTFDGLFGT